MSSLNHTPVLKEQVINYLIKDQSGIYLDCTIGAGGHSYGILKKLSSSGQLIGLDSDETVLEPTHILFSVFNKNQYSLHHSNFYNFPKITV